MGYWNYTHIGASATQENKKHVEKIFDYIGYGRELDYSDGEECSFAEPEIYRCRSSENPSVKSQIHEKFVFLSFSENELLNLLNALFPGTSVYVHQASGNNTSDTWENHDRIYDISSMTMNSTDSYTAYGSGGTSEKRYGQKPFTISLPEPQYVYSLILLSNLDGNTELATLLEKLIQRYEEDDAKETIQMQQAMQQFECASVISDGKLEKFKRSLFNGNVVIIPNTITSIGSRAFSNCEKLYKIRIPESISIIGNGAFSGCINLVSINIPGSVTKIGNEAFYNCGSLRSITIPNGITAINAHTFSSCENLISIKIPDTVTIIKLHAFSFCYSLTNICIPTSVKKIEQYAFANCSNLKNVIIPENVISIGDYAFRRCKNLISITIPDRVTSIGESSFEDCGSLKYIITPTGSYAEEYAKNHNIPVQNE